MNWEKYSHALGNLWELVSHISESSGLFNWINFYSKLILWEQSSFSYDILRVCYGDCLGFLITLISSSTHSLGMIWLSTYVHVIGIRTFLNKIRRREELGNCLCFPTFTLLTLECLCFPLLSTYYGNLLFSRLGNCMAFCFLRQM